MTNNKTVLDWIEKMVQLVKPDKVVWIDGSEEQLEALRVNDVARVEHRTFICCDKEEDAGPTNHWMAPDKAYEMLYDIARDSYKGRTMYVIPYSMGPIGSPLAKVGIELTDSIYVVLNMAIMARVGQKVLDVLGDSNDWVRGLHRRITPSSPSTPATAGMCCWAKNALRCASRPTRAATRAGWLSTC